MAGEPSQNKNASSAQSKKYRSVRFGLALVILLAMPVGHYLWLETEPDQFRPLFVVEKPGIGAVRALSGPTVGTEHRQVQTPEFVKGIYMTANTAGYKKRFNQLIDLVDRTEINALVIDIKDHNGRLAFTPASPELKPYASENIYLGDLKEFTAPLKERGIYLIARQFVFQDPQFAEAHPEWAVANTWGGLWRDYRGIPWLDAASKDVWRYNVQIAREVFEGGFDEIQFDYIRFPSDGNIKAAEFPVWDGTTPKSEVMAGFFAYLDKELRVKNNIPISVDLFGLTMWQHDYDLNIGQLLRDALPHFDFISPMVYPSHYPPGFNGYANPAEHPYEVVYENLVRGQAVYEQINQAAIDQGVDPPPLATIRPWIQDFDLGAVYTPERVRAQFTATEDGGGSGWLIWNARNVYTEGAFKPAPAD